MGLFGKKKDNAEKSGGSEVTLEDGSRISATQVVDCIGDSCPRPQLMTKAALGKAAPGDVIEIQVDNPTSMEALPPMMPELNGSNLGTVRQDRYWSVMLRKD